MSLLDAVARKSEAAMLPGPCRASADDGMWSRGKNDGETRPSETFVSTLPGVSVGKVLLRFVREPRKYLLARWNWKSAVLSSLFRAAIFFFANLTAGWPAALAAMSTELIFRGITSGFYGALTEGFREAEPPWAAALGVLLVLPVANHSMEFVVHWLRGTRKLVPSITASVVFTALSTLFNLYAMRRGALIVGTGRNSLRQDLRRMPGLLLEFILLIPRRLMAGPTREAEIRDVS
jgi:hypothetical protein